MELGPVLYLGTSTTRCFPVREGNTAAVFTAGHNSAIGQLKGTELLRDGQGEALSIEPRSSRERGGGRGKGGREHRTSRQKG